MLKLTFWMSCTPAATLIVVGSRHYDCVVKCLSVLELIWLSCIILFSGYSTSYLIIWLIDCWLVVRVARSHSSCLIWSYRIIFHRSFLNRWFPHRSLNCATSVLKIGVFLVLIRIIIHEETSNLLDGCLSIDYIPSLSRYSWHHSPRGSFNLTDVLAGPATEQPTSELCLWGMRIHSLLVVVADDVHDFCFYYNPIYYLASTSLTVYFNILFIYK